MVNNQHQRANSTMGALSKDNKMQTDAKKEAKKKAELLAAYVVSHNCTVADAAGPCGMATDTAYKHSRSPAYRTAKLERLTDRADAIASDAIAFEAEALATLRDCMASPRDDVRVAASKGILSHAARAASILEKQLAAAERRERVAAYDAVSSILEGLLPESD